MSDAPHFILSIDKANEAEGIRSFLTSIRSLIWPTVKTTPLDITLEHLTNGTSNRVFKCTVPESSEIALMRIYGETSSLLIDRDHELSMIKKISDGNVGAHLYATFQNGYVLEFIKGTLLRVEDFANPHFYEQIARQVADIHRIRPLPADLTALAAIQKRGIWNTLQRWMDVAQAQTMDDTAREHLNNVAKEIKEYEAFMAVYNSQPLVFCHNDLNHANMLWDPIDGASQEDGKPSGAPKITFLDLEYAGFNFRGYDIGNHFCEWAGLTRDNARYPNKDERKNFLSHYLRRVNDSGSFTEAELAALTTECERFAQVSHLAWHVWALALAYSPKKASNFDYLKYAAQRWTEYQARKVDSRAEIYGM